MELQNNDEVLVQDESTPTNFDKKVIKEDPFNNPETNPNNQPDDNTQNVDINQPLNSSADNQPQQNNTQSNFAKKDNNHNRNYSNVNQSSTDDPFGSKDQTQYKKRNPNAGRTMTNNMHKKQQSSIQFKSVNNASRGSSVYNNPNSAGSTGNLQKMDAFANKEYGDNIWSRKSAATLTHSVLNYSFSKGERFNHHKKTNSSGSMYNLHSTLGKRSTSLGKGNKGFFNRKWANDNANKPAPTHYRIASDFDKNHLSKSFGISYEYYSKATP